MRVMLDSNVYDSLLDDVELLEQVGAAIYAHRVQVLTTHIQLDEHDLVKWPAKREALLALPITFVKVATSGAFWSVPKWDEAEWGDESGRMEGMVGGNKAHIEDALIVATANAKADVLVTNETRLANRAKRAGFTIKVWTVDQFSSWLRPMP
jgi:predicted nucleic acid-binding protein